MADMRWIERLDSFASAMLKLHTLDNLATERDLSEMEIQAMLRAFKVCYELSWKVIHDFYHFQGGHMDIQGSRDAFRLAFQRGLIEDGQLWMNMLASHQRCAEAFDHEIAEAIAEDIIHEYYPAMTQLQNRLQAKAAEYGLIEQGNRP